MYPEEYQSYMTWDGEDETMPEPEARLFAWSEKHPKFTENLDVQLLHGVLKHNHRWQEVSRDAYYEFAKFSGQPLRDRYRVRYPDRYVKAGYELDKRKQNKRFRDAQQYRLTPDNASIMHSQSTVVMESEYENTEDEHRTGLQTKKRTHENSMLSDYLREIPDKLQHRNKAAKYSPNFSSEEDFYSADETVEIVTK